MEAAFDSALRELLGVEDDERTKGWLLMSSPLPTLAIMIAYLVVVKGGQVWMRDRAAFKLENFARLYNVFTVLLNAFLAYEFTYVAYHESLGLCSGVDKDPSNQNSLRLAGAIWWYYVSKMFEFVDTFIFVLRKKDRQISFLHLYHHSTMFPLWWIATRWSPGGQAYFSAMLNSYVHVVMYFYYFITTFEAYKTVSWKKYVTYMQLGQFYLVLLDTVYTIVQVRRGQCQLYEWMAWLLAIYMGTMIILFNLFFQQAYSKGDKTSKKQEKSE